MNIQKLPARDKRLESGPLQVEEDWPGIFIRGDEALAYAESLRQFIYNSKQYGVFTRDLINGITVEGLQRLLESCRQERRREAK